MVVLKEVSVNVSIVNCENTGIINSVVDSGSHFQSHYVSASGIATLFSVSQDYSFSIVNCHNKGPVSVESFNDDFTVVASGIASAVNSSNGEGGDPLLVVKECVNTGIVNARGKNETTYASGITSSDRYVGISVVSCFNKGNIVSSGNVSGIAMSIKEISNSANVGNLTGQKRYGIADFVSSSFGVVSICDFAPPSGTSFATYSSAKNSRYTYFLDAQTTVQVGTPIVPNEITKRWEHTSQSNRVDTADILNGKVIEHHFTRWWTSNLTLGHRVEVVGEKLPSFFDKRPLQLVAEHGEVLGDAIVREGAGELLNGSYTLKGSPYDVNDIVKSNCTLTVVAVHTLVFHGCGVNVTLKVPNGDVLTTEQRAKLHGFLDSNDYLIVSDDDNKTVFNANDPVTNSTRYTIMKAKSLVVVVDGTLTDDDIKDIVAVVDDDNAVVCVVVAGKEDDRTTLIITVNEEQVISIKDILAGCIASRE